MTKESLDKIARFLNHPTIRKIDNRKVQNWNFVMEIVDKINNLRVEVGNNNSYTFSVTIYSYQCSIELCIGNYFPYETRLLHDWKLDASGGESNSIRNVWGAILQFLVWMELSTEEKLKDL